MATAGSGLSAPLSPALRLGATRILAVSPQYLCAEAERPKATGYPPLAQIFSELLNAIFLDVLEQDVEGRVVPTFERFFLGGERSLRVFRTRSVSPTRRDKDLNGNGTIDTPEDSNPTGSSSRART